MKLVIAGGWDARVEENVSYHKELETLAFEEFKFKQSSIKFIRSFDDKEKEKLIATARVVLYTPSNEHFGIVPLEAMAHRTPVIAVNNGGPKETIVDGKTGFLCESNAQTWSERVLDLAQDLKKAESMGIEGRKRVEGSFSFSEFREKLHKAVTSAKASHSSRRWTVGISLAVIFSFVGCIYCLLP
eukprot:CAMPEP_0167741580 /NCGR_PEP_ID=MMETSP0110_2-20121227/936_1 /TAXON_ID=629695 /ORGANISM="Gymnochlora sp., Strain CCMP2014" /LENGTH=185 /DNA_ID=CAMNT_0007625649 /DNA_START=285 /DNA_END=842 /DNA_ORIENTATION=+